MKKDAGQKTRQKLTSIQTTSKNVRGGITERNFQHTSKREVTKTGAIKNSHGEVVALRRDTVHPQPTSKSKVKLSP
jgi:hypothetical protein